MRPKIPYQTIYPDVLGAITGGPRVNIDTLECALGMFPRSAYLNQPVELILPLQSMIDRPIQVKVGIRLPSVDRKGDVAVFETPKSMISVSLKPGEVGVLRMPVIARSPTQPGKDYPVRVALRFRVQNPDDARFVRPPGGGAPPSVLSVSPFKLQVLRDVEYAAHKWNESTDIMTVYFDIAPRRLPNTPEIPKPRYETLWSQEEMAEESRQTQEYYDEALHLADSTAYTSSYLSFMDAVEARFAQRGLPLHPGEAMAIAKMLAYAVDEAPIREPDSAIERSRWFAQLCQVLASNPALLEMDRNDLISHHCFEGALYEAILIGFTILQTRVKEDLGSREERLNYANRVMRWFAGHGEADLSYVYLPLVLCGLVISRNVRSSTLESPWDIADELTEAYNGRVRLVDDSTGIVFDLLHTLLENYIRTLTMQRIERPNR